MKKLSILFVMLLSVWTLAAQVPESIEIIPANATGYDELTLIFDPAIACIEGQSLVGEDSVGFHSGVKTNYGDWQYVVEFTQTGANGQAPILYPTFDGRFFITYTPSEYYGVLPGTTIYGINCVFNNAINWDAVGKDHDPDNPGQCMDFFIPLDTNVLRPYVEMHVNMSEAALQGIFNPESDAMKVGISDFGEYTMEDPDNDSIYTRIFEDEMDFNYTYHYIYKINDNLLEDDSSMMIPVNDTTLVIDWWNDMYTDIGKQGVWEFGIYPNPAKEMVYIQLPDNKEYTLKIYTPQSRLVKQEDISGQLSVISVSELQTGTYILHLDDGTTKHTQKLFIY